MVRGGKDKPRTPRVVETHGETVASEGMGSVPVEVVPPLESGRKYRGQWIVRGTVSALLTPAQAAGLVEEELLFSQVKTFRAAAELPPDWPKDQRSLMTATLDHWSFFFEGFATRTALDFPRPASLLSIWDAKFDRAPGENLSGSVLTLPEVTISPRMMIGGLPLSFWVAAGAGTALAMYWAYRHYYPSLEEDRA